MKQIGCLILATALLVGCSKQQQYFLGTILVEVDGALYGLAYYVDHDAHVDRQGQVSSFLALHCALSEDRPDYTPITIAVFHDHDHGIRRPTLWLRDGKEAVPKAQTLYFAPDEETIIEKDYRELGIDASRLSTDHKALLAYLRPILEPLIREHIQPQEPEME